jgi:spermidine/putrescine transport system permease protein
MFRRAPYLSTYYVLLLIALYIPIAILFLFSLNNGVIFAFPLTGLTTHWYADMLQNKELLNALRNSVIVAVSSSFASVALGTLAAIGLARFEFKGKSIFVAAALLPLLVPFIIVGVALLILFAGLQIERSLLTVTIAHTIVSLPYTLLVIMSRMAGFDKHLEEAAQDLGATYPYTLRRVIIPMIGSAILAAWLVAFTVSFDEFVLASFLIGGSPTLPIYLFGQLRFAKRFPQVVALAMVVMVVSIGLVVFAEWLQRRGAENVRTQPAFDEDDSDEAEPASQTGGG